jgi:hypothetical protein
MSDGDMKNWSCFLGTRVFWCEGSFLILDFYYAALLFHTGPYLFLYHIPLNVSILARHSLKELDQVYYTNDTQTCNY